MEKTTCLFFFFISCQSQENCFIVTVVSVLCCHGVHQNPGLCERQENSQFTLGLPFLCFLHHFAFVTVSIRNKRSFCRHPRFLSVSHPTLLSLSSRLQPAAAPVAASPAVPGLQPGGCPGPSRCLPGAGAAAAGAAAAAVPGGQLSPAALHHAGLPARRLQRHPGGAGHLPAAARLHPPARQHHDPPAQRAQPLRPQPSPLRATGLHPAWARLPLGRCPWRRRLTRAIPSQQTPGFLIEIPKL